MLPILPCGYYKFTFMSIDLHTCSLFFHAATTNLPSCRLISAHAPYSSMRLLQIYLHVDRSPHLLPILPCGNYKFTFMSIDLRTCSLFFHAATTNLPSCRLISTHAPYSSMRLLQIYLHADRSPHMLPILPCGYYKFTFMSIDLHTCSLFFHAATTNLPSCR